jgi:serine O-acetyltransferase
LIQDKKEYKQYFLQDLKQTGLLNNIWYNKILDRRYRFYKLLRYTEYRYNCKKSFLDKIFNKFIMIKYQNLCNKYNWTIPINVFGPGLTIVHSGTIVVSGDAKIGKNCRIHVCTNIGKAYSHGKSGAPIIRRQCLYRTRC